MKENFVETVKIKDLTKKILSETLKYMSGELETKVAEYTEGFYALKEENESLKKQIKEKDIEAKELKNTLEEMEKKYESLKGSVAKTKNVSKDVLTMNLSWKEHNSGE